MTLRSVSAILCLTMLGAAVQPVRSAPRQSEQRTVETILGLERARNEAILRGDAATLARMTSDDYSFITIRGELRTKPEIVKGFASGAFKYDARQISDLKVRIYGTTAIVTGRASQKGVENAKDYSGAYRFTRVYVKQHGAWQTVALQTTLETP